VRLFFSILLFFISIHHHRHHQSMMHFQRQNRQLISFFSKSIRYHNTSTRATTTSTTTTRYFNSSQTLSNSTTPKISKIKSYEHNNALHFIISSNEDKKDQKKSIILSPSFFADEEEKDVVLESIDDDSSQDVVLESISSRIEARYGLDNQAQFVGGMGENDGGVWFVADTLDDFDTLDYWEQIRDVIRNVKENRHGIPFGLYTSGIIDNKELASDFKGSIGISSIQVTLGAADPKSYGDIISINHENKSLSNAMFGEVCNFIVLSSESGFPVTAALAGGKHAAPGNELAKALGAIDTVVYDQIK